ncbi:MAG: hypothetical protein OEM26_08470, partial [Saprospiraceae bacterium]|nr:hypothetical protein [Saprospiraceae bacterium]
KLSHLGLINTDESGSLRVSCTNYGDRIVGYVTSHFVGANGDALDTQVELEVRLTPAPVFPEQILWNIVGGSGRFENTTGSFVTTFETVPNEPLQTRLQIISGCMTPPGISKHLDGE